MDGGVHFSKNLIEFKVPVKSKKTIVAICLTNRPGILKCPEVIKSKSAAVICIFSTVNSPLVLGANSLNYNVQ